jgi:hypothetical protein
MDTRMRPSVHTQAIPDTMDSLAESIHMSHGHTNVLAERAIAIYAVVHATTKHSRS